MNIPTIKKNETLLNYFKRLENNSDNLTDIVKYLIIINAIYYSKLNSDTSESFKEEILQFGKYFKKKYNLSTVNLREAQWGIKDAEVLQIYDILKNLETAYKKLNTKQILLINDFVKQINSIKEDKFICFCNKNNYIESVEIEDDTYGLEIDSIIRTHLANLILGCEGVVTVKYYEGNNKKEISKAYRISKSNIEEVTKY